MSEVLKLSGPLIKCGELTHNGRIYDYESLKKQLENFMSNSPIGGTPDSYNYNGFLSLEKASHRVKDIHFNDDTQSIDVDIEVLATPVGKVIEALVKAGVRVGATPVGVGEVNEDGTIKNYELRGISIVSGDECLENTQLKIKRD